MSSIQQLINPYIPINSFVEQKIEPIVIARPEVGIRWGSQSAFEFSNKKKSGRIIFTYDVEEPAKNKVTNIISFSGIATQYILKPEEQTGLTGLIRFTNTMQFTGTVPIERYKEGRRQLPGSMTFIYTFKLKLNADFE